MIQWRLFTFRPAFSKDFRLRPKGATPDVTPRQAFSGYDASIRMETGKHQGREKFLFRRRSVNKLSGRSVFHADFFQDIHSRAPVGKGRLKKVNPDESRKKEPIRGMIIRQQDAGQDEKPC
jgi:hypothetical protein